MLSQTNYQQKLTRAAQRIRQEAKARSASGAAVAVNYAEYLTIQDKSDNVIPYVPNRVQQHFRQHRTGRDLVLKARQHGMSTEIQARQFVESITRRVRSATLAHDDAGTQFLRRMADRFWQGLPDDIRPERGLDNATTTSYLNTGSEVFIATAGGKNKGRAGTYTMAHGSEVAFWTDATAVMAGLLQGVPADGQIVLESTPNGAQGWFYERCMEALDGAGKWMLHFYPWWWSGDYQTPLEADEVLVYESDEQILVDAHGLTPEQIKWRRGKQQELGRLFQQEYPEDPQTCFLVSGVGYFSDIPDLDGVFSADTHATPVNNHRIVAGLDFAQTQDYLALSIVDATTFQEIDLWRVNRRSWGDLRLGVLERCRKWHVNELHAEANSMGSTNIEELIKEFSTAGVRTQVYPFQTTAQTKPPLIQGFHWALGEGGLKLLPPMGIDAPSTVAKQEIFGFTASQTPNGSWKYEGQPHDDTVIARALAWFGVNHRGYVEFGSAPQEVADLFGG